MRTGEQQKQAWVSWTNPITSGVLLAAAVVTACTSKIETPNVPSSGEKPSTTEELVASGHSNIVTGDSKQDVWDHLIIRYSQQYGYPDPRFVKAQVKWESMFDANAVSSDSPCGGSGLESKSLGLLQITPGCGEAGGLSLEQDPSSPDYANSVFNPSVNLDRGIKLMAGNYKDMKSMFPGCTDEQYMEMAAAGYVQRYETITGCEKYSDPRQEDYVARVKGYYESWYGKYPSAH